MMERISHTTGGGFWPGHDRALPKLVVAALPSSFTLEKRESDIDAGD